MSVFEYTAESGQRSSVHGLCACARTFSYYEHYAEVQAARWEAEE
jgi:hypothetical protein